MVVLPGADTVVVPEPPEPAVVVAEPEGRH